MYNIVSEPFENYIILKIDIGDEIITDWLSNNRHIFIPELITTAEKILYDDIDDVVPVMKLVGSKITEFVNSSYKSKSKKSTIDPSIIISLTKDDIGDMLSKSIEWAIYAEEYELAHRIKLLQELNEVHSST